MERIPHLPRVLLLLVLLLNIAGICHGRVQEPVRKKRSTADGVFKLSLIGQCFGEDFAWHESLEIWESRNAIKLREKFCHLLDKDRSSRLFAVECVVTSIHPVNRDDERQGTIFKGKISIETTFRDIDSISSIQKRANTIGACELSWQDFDECSTVDHNDCHMHAKCFNTLGDHVCACKDGYVDTEHATLRPGRFCELGKRPIGRGNFYTWLYTLIAVCVVIVCLICFCVFCYWGKRYCFSSNKSSVVHEPHANPYGMATRVTPYAAPYAAPAPVYHPPPVLPPPPPPQPAPAPQPSISLNIHVNSEEKSKPAPPPIIQAPAYQTVETSFVAAAPAYTAVAAAPAYTSVAAAPVYGNVQGIGYGCGDVQGIGYGDVQGIGYGDVQAIGYGDVQGIGYY